MIIQVQLCLLNLVLCLAVGIKQKITLDEFFDSTDFSLLSFSPSGQYLLFQTKRPLWNISSFENNLWLYNIDTQTKTLVHHYNHNGHQAEI